MSPLAPVLSTQEVAELLRLSDRSVLEMVKAGTLPAHRAPGRRRYHFLAEDVLAAIGVRAAAVPDGAPADGATRASPDERAPAPVDPCDVWGAAPARTGSADWPTRCVEQWLAMAADAGLSARAGGDGHRAVGGRAVGSVEIDGLTYRVLAGPRQRVRCVGDNGELGWSFIDSVWAEPVT